VVDLTGGGNDDVLEEFKGVIAKLEEQVEKHKEEYEAGKLRLVEYKKEFEENCEEMKISLNETKEAWKYKEGMLSRYKVGVQKYPLILIFVSGLEHFDIGSKEIREKMVCPICHMLFMEGEKVVSLPHCQACRFHGKCISEMLLRNPKGDANGEMRCPLCRQTYEKKW
jgi:hypothetical protein